jgi:hypothetical protein
MEKSSIFGMIQRGGQVVIRMLANVKQTTIGPMIRRAIAPGDRLVGSTRVREAPEGRSVGLQPGALGPRGGRIAMYGRYTLRAPAEEFASHLDVRPFPSAGPRFNVVPTKESFGLLTKGIDIHAAGRTNHAKSGSSCFF